MLACCIADPPAENPAPASCEMCETELGDEQHDTIMGETKNSWRKETRKPACFLDARARAKLQAGVASTHLSYHFLLFFS